MNGDLTCPYCEAVQQMHEPDDIDADMCLTECEQCNKQFWYSISVQRSYHSTTYEEG